LERLADGRADEVIGLTLGAEQLRAAFEAAGGRWAITYYGSGMAAACDAFALPLLGHDDVAMRTEEATEPECPFRPLALDD